MYTQPIEAGGDAIKKWVYVVNFWEKDTNTLENHHTMRWAVNLPGVALVTAMGSKPTMYYLLPLSAFSVGVGLLCSIARRRLSVASMAALVILLFLEPMMQPCFNAVSANRFRFRVPGSQPMVLARLGTKKANKKFGPICCLFVSCLWCQSAVCVLSAGHFVFRLRKRWIACRRNVDRGFRIILQHGGAGIQHDQ